MTENDSLKTKTGQSKGQSWGFNCVIHLVGERATLADPPAVSLYVTLSCSYLLYKQESYSPQDSILGTMTQFYFAFTSNRATQFTANLMVGLILFVGCSYCCNAYLPEQGAWPSWGGATWRYTSACHVLCQGLPSILSGFSHLGKKSVSAWLNTEGAPCTYTLFITPSMTILFKHTFYRCHSFPQGPMLLLIYISIKQYGYNGFTTPLALGRWSWFVGRSNNTNSTFTAVNCFCICTRGFLQFEGLFMDSCSILTIFF